MLILIPPSGSDRVRQILNRAEPMSVDLMPNRYTPGEADLAPRDAELIARREGVLGSSYRLQYRRPVHFVAGEGMWLYDPDGRAYLDFYNNVPSLGHCNPEVNAAMAEQAGRISANTRYLEPRLVDYAERLVATFPTELDRVVFTCTGSESNDLALRIARLVSGSDGVIVSAYAYHGTSAAAAMVSPNLGDAVELSPATRMVDLPGPAGLPESQAAGFFEAQVRAAIRDLRRRGIGVAALLVDSIFSSDGVWVDPPAFITGAVAAVREAGGLFIADEVQPGFGRTGAHMWGFERHGVAPDLVTLGKPMGNGFPIGAVVGRRALVDRFGATARYSNTFAGNTVGIATADAVLTILQRDRIPQNALAMGDRLKAGLGALAKRTEGLLSVRHAGLFFGIDVGLEGMPPAGRRAMALDVVNAMRDDGVLISTTGANEDVLKVRPPLVCETKHVDRFLEALEASLRKTARAAVPKA
jgi:4-aminobutyrate aminotransferase-like enzyme